MKCFYIADSLGWSDNPASTSVTNDLFLQETSEVKKNT